MVHESGCFGYEPARAFISYGWDTFIVNPADIPRPSKNKFAKSDKIDAKNLSEQLRSGHLKKIEIPDPIREGLRSLTRQRTALVRDFRRIKTRIKSLLLYYHITIPEGMDTPKWPIRFLDWLEDLELNNFNQKDTIQSMLRQYRFIDLELKDLSNRIRKYCKKNLTKDYQLLRSVPGIAGLSAGYILSELGNLRRFSSLKKLASYVGFLPIMKQSGDMEIAVGANPRANRHIRKILIEASWIAIRVDPVMQNYYRSHKGINSKAAIFKVGRKLLSKLYAIVKTETSYELGLIK